MRDIKTSHYCDQVKRWPSMGRHILAQFDGESVIVYQAYRPEIGEYALQHGRFGGEFSFRRMSWIKPNFLWMMYRSNWGESEGQQVVLGLRLRREFFDTLLAQAVRSSYAPELGESHASWKQAVEQSDVRLQWDPDHAPDGMKCERRAIQLGLRGETLEAYGQREILEVIDMRPLVEEQRRFAPSWRDGRLVTPTERVYRPGRPDATMNVGLDDWTEPQVLEAGS